MLLYNEQACQMPCSKLEPLLRQLEPGKKGVDKVVKKKEVLYKSILIVFIKKWSFEKTFVQIFFSKTGQKRSKKTKIAPFSSYRGQMATCQRSKTKELQRPLYWTLPMPSVLCSWVYDDSSSRTDPALQLHWWSLLSCTPYGRGPSNSRTEHRRSHPF